ncbi:AAA family ATPase [Luteolibacter sp. GHJ8]|uniref:AAA family ATPase n=1 Tax=Luteolibacter rhizosphaerae TaxID=2989719 RepID=A0ABT3G1G9_9BACT|nr:AAA family ATPase [Luteolibacter rhizosphaerae]MCW1913676.1 AAA family ATPase [Luteolibacter rhizosphaerae]
MGKKKNKAPPVLLQRLGDHFGTDPGALPLVERSFAKYDRPNLHQAIMEIAGAGVELLGVIPRNDYEPVTLARIVRQASAKNMDLGPVQHVDETLPGNRRMACVKRGLFLFRYRDMPVAIMQDEERFTSSPRLTIEVMAGESAAAEELLRRIEKETLQGKAFRGGVISLKGDCHRGFAVQFHQLPALAREEVILPEDLLQRLERHTVDFSRQSGRLKAAGRHLKRGILLHGPPGTGKTYSAMHLASRMPERTVFLLTGADIGMIEQAVAMARILDPATLILEDVDLIGTRRENQMVGANAVLFELLNQMDGLAEDADLLFILTTNRPDVLEPALAARPGRIDQAIEIPPPDEDCRRRLIALYGKGLVLELEELDDLVRRIEGVSAAFIRELLRKAAVHAALEEDGEIVVRDRHLAAALAELMVAGGPLTMSLLGASVASED